MLFVTNRKETLDSPWPLLSSSSSLWANLLFQPHLCPLLPSSLWAMWPVDCTGLHTPGSPHSGFSLYRYWVEVVHSFYIAFIKDCLHRDQVEIVHLLYTQQFYNRPENKTADAVTINIYLHNPQLASLSELQFCFLFNWPFGETLWEKKIKQN